MDVAEVDQRRWLEESRQWLENVDQTHLVLASGKRVLQKRYKELLQQDILLGLALEEVVEGDLAQLLDGEVLREDDAAGEEREGVSVEGIGVEPDGVGDRQDAALDVFHVLAEAEDLVLPAPSLPGGANIGKRVHLLNGQLLLVDRFYM